MIAIHQSNNRMFLLTKLSIPIGRTLLLHKDVLIFQKEIPPISQLPIVPKSYAFSSKRITIYQWLTHLALSTPHSSRARLWFWNNSIKKHLIYIPNGTILNLQNLHQRRIFHSNNYYISHVLNWKIFRKKMIRIYSNELFLSILQNYSI